MRWTDKIKLTDRLLELIQSGLKYRYKNSVIEFDEYHQRDRIYVINCHIDGKKKIIDIEGLENLNIFLTNIKSLDENEPAKKEPEIFSYNDKSINNFTDPDLKENPIKMLQQALLEDFKIIKDNPDYLLQAKQRAETAARFMELKKLEHDIKL
jgi:hypothetical protein